MKLQKQQIYREIIFIHPPLTTTVFAIMVVSQLPVRSCLTARRVFKGDYSIGLTKPSTMPLHSLRTTIASK